MQLVAYGAQDIYLTGNPMITYFKVVYRRHTNFAMESIQQTFNGTGDFGSKVSCLISRNGDLVSGMIVEANLPNLNTAHVRWVSDVGHYLIQEVSVEIGGQQIDKHYADWLEVWAQLSVPAGQKVGYREMIGQSQLGTGGALGVMQDVGNIPATTVYVPLQFWFCRNVGLALPLIALQYHEVKVNITFASSASLTRTEGADDGVITAAGTTFTGLSASLWVDYIYLDTDERRRFAQVSHEYLIEQLQFTGDESTNAVLANATGSKNIDLNLNHPVKELVWVCKATGTNAEPSVFSLVAAELTPAGSDNFMGRRSATAPVASAKLQLNGQDRISARDGSYFNLVQTRCHSNIPDSRGIYVYSFALKPEDHQPSGTCNFSRIDNAKLCLTLGSTAALAVGVCKVFAVNYNVLRIMSGMGGLAYSN